MVDLIPRDVLFGNPERISPRISPDGSRLAWIAPHNGVLNVWVAPVGTSGVEWDAAAVITDDTDRGIRTFTWARDGRHLLYLQDTGGDENWRLYDVDLETPADAGGQAGPAAAGGQNRWARRDLTPFDGIQTRILATRKSHRDEILVGMNRDNPQLHDVYRLDLNTGDLAKLIDNPGYAGWLVDEDMVVRGALKPLPEGGFDLLVRDDAEAGWRTLLTISADDAPNSDVLAFTGDGKSLIAISSAGVNTGRLVRIDLSSAAEQVLLADPDADVTGAMLHPDTREPQLGLVLKDRAEYHVLDPAVEPDFESIRALNTGDPSVIGRDEADATWLAAFNDDVRPVRYYAYDRAARTGRFLFDSRPELSRYELARMEPFSFTSRDGLTVHGYVTFPPGGGRSGLPAVLDVHGGPQVRDVWGWNPEAQWFANRGYLCIQVNYRGSTGYGKAFVNAGDREWGAKMHDDLIDAVGYVVEQGWADPDRIAIYGGSYGGYAALVGAAFTPDVFRCAVDIVGPSNLQTLLETIPPYWAPVKAQLYKRVGNPEADKEFLWSRSPLSRVRDIRIPLLIAQGANDPRVKQAESEQIVAALADAGIDYEYLLFPDEGHGFAKPENRLKFYAAAERFLAKYLGGRFEE
jgi:dipeptidyl aminopeptidase/acylaminoacyl peptidase